METQGLTADEAKHVHDMLDELAGEVGKLRLAMDEEKARHALRVARLTGLLEQLLEELQDRQDITDSGGPDWCMRYAMRIESALAERE